MLNLFQHLLLNQIVYFCAVKKIPENIGGFEYFCSVLLNDRHIQRKCV